MLSRFGLKPNITFFVNMTDKHIPTINIYSLVIFHGIGVQDYLLNAKSKLASMCLTPVNQSVSQLVIIISKVAKMA